MASPMSLLCHDSQLSRGMDNFSRKRQRSTFESDMSPAPSETASDLNSPCPVTTESYDSPQIDGLVSKMRTTVLNDVFDDGSLSKYLTVRKRRNGRSKLLDANTSSPLFPIKNMSISESFESCGIVNTPRNHSRHNGSMLNYMKIKKQRTLSPESIFANKRSTISPDKCSSDAKDPLSPVRPITAITPKQECGEEEKKCQTPNPVDIAIGKSMDNPSLIGDFSEVCLLPTISGKNKDMPSISPETMVQVLNGKYDGTFMIVDCRYPYEYEGGHIIGAKNFYIKKAMSRKLFPSNIQMNNPTRPILIFHCEFSSKRAPDMYRFVRNKDRKMNAACYPALYYPEMYVLEGGYASFYAEHKDYCDPKNYKKMLDTENTEDMSHFRAECKFNDRDGKRERPRSNGVRAKLVF